MHNACAEHIQCMCRAYTVYVQTINNCQVDQPQHAAVRCRAELGDRTGSVVKEQVNKQEMQEDVVRCLILSAASLAAHSMLYKTGQATHTTSDSAVKDNAWLVGLLTSAHMTTNMVYISDTS